MITLKGLIITSINIILIFSSLIFKDLILLLISFSFLTFLTHQFFSIHRFDKETILFSFKHKTLIEEGKESFYKFEVDMKKDLLFSIHPICPTYMSFDKEIKNSIYEKSRAIERMVTFKNWGCYKIYIPEIRIYDNFHLYNRTIKLGKPQNVFVSKKYSKAKQGSSYSHNKNKAGIGSRITRQGYGDADFKQIRVYSEGDDFRKIDWNNTAKKGKIMVKDYYPETFNNIHLILDLGSNMNIGYNDNVMSTSIFAATNLVNMISKSKNYLGITLLADKMLESKNATGKNIINNFQKMILRFNSDFKTDYDSSFYEIAKKIKKRSSIIIISNMGEDKKEFIDSLSYFKKKKHSIYILNPFEPLFEEEDSLAYKTLYKKFEDEIESLKETLKSVKLENFGPEDYNPKTQKAYQMIEHKEF